MCIKAKAKERLVIIQPRKNETLENLREAFSSFKILAADEDQRLRSPLESKCHESNKGPLSILPPASSQVVQTRKQCGDERLHTNSL